MAEYLKPFNLENKLKNAEIALDEAGIDKESMVRWAVAQAVRKEHYSRVFPAEGLNEEGKRQFYDIFNSLTINRLV